ncbi:MAG: hypothetical protein ABW003_01680, partial [Microvirga sp.]
MILQQALIHTTRNPTIIGCLMRAARKVVTTVQKVVHRIAQWPNKTIHLIYSFGPIKLKVTNNRKSLVRNHSRNLPVLTTQETLIADALKGQGFCVTSRDVFECFRSENFLAAGGDIYQLMEQNYLQTGKHIGIVKLLNVEPSLIDQFETIFRAGLDIRLLKIVEHYLQLPVAYGGVDIFFTAADGLERGARTWHKDSEDSPMVKVAVYFNHVGDDDGPFEILHLPKASTSLEALRGFKQQKLIDARNQGKIKFEITSFTGSAETVSLCDTAKYFHRGKPATGQ